MDISIREITLKAKKYLDKREDIILAFLFGSAVKGRLREGSDIDIALLFDNKPSYSFLVEVINELSTAICREVDIVVLNDASPIICMQVLKYGILLKKDERAYNEFFVRTLKLYDDLKFKRREGEANILRGRMYA